MGETVRKIMALLLPAHLRHVASVLPHAALPGLQTRLASQPESAEATCTAVIPAVSLRARQQARRHARLACRQQRLACRAARASSAQIDLLAVAPLDAVSPYGNEEFHVSWGEVGTSCGSAYSMH